MRVKEIAELLSINVGRVEAIASALKINHSADLSDENVEAIAKVAEEMARQNTASIDQAVRSVMGAPAQSEPQRPEPPRKKSEGCGITAAIAAANDKRALAAAQYKETERETTRKLVQGGQERGAKNAQIYKAAELDAFVITSQQLAAQTGDFYSQVFDALDQSAGEGALEGFTVGGVETLAALPQADLNF